MDGGLIPIPGSWDVALAIYTILNVPTPYMELHPTVSIMRHLDIYKYDILYYCILLVLLFSLLLLLLLLFLFLLLLLLV